jgi:hypothetical protein
LAPPQAGFEPLFDHAISHRSANLTLPSGDTHNQARTADVHKRVFSTNPTRGEEETSPQRYRYGAVFEQEFATHLNGMDDAIETVAECLCPAQGRMSNAGEAASPGFRSGTSWLAVAALELMLCD